MNFKLVLTLMWRKILTSLPACLNPTTHKAHPRRSNKRYIAIHVLAALIFYGIF